MKVLVIGAGGREHAICWKLRQSPLITELYCAPGNPGIAEIADLVPIAVDEIHKLADFAAELSMDLTVVGPELPLVLGIADELTRRGLAVFGPNKRAAELEGSKVFAKEFMRRHSIPTAPFEVAHDASEARRLGRRFGFPVVLKADGLAAGKGVYVVRDAAAFEESLRIFFEQKRFGAAAGRLVIEDCLEGEEVSLMALCDGRGLLPFAAAKDYKRLREDDEGPNTGGMGAHSPTSVMPSGVGAAIIEQVLTPTVRGLAAESRDFVGVLYAGLMLTREGPRVLEYNVRFGDPEAQPLLLRLSDDLLPILAQGAAGRFETQRLHFTKSAAACVVLASRGYPETPTKGEAISGIERALAHPEVAVFHAGTARTDSGLVTAGGRVLDVCACGNNLREALRRAYVASAEITWPSKILRRDIGRRVLERPVSGSGS